ncbi:hypothetical protein PG993_005292 [Apiospora rasikravindrae]|uniref:Uncharacterized protein n=1 Tax=Apiospora rasikravindrae TaxID=990691 RepID=A0ABR1TF54_9PEZI
MSSTVFQSATRSATRALGRKSQAPRVNACRTSRTYSSQHKPPPSQGGNNRAIGIALVGLTLPALYLYTSRSASGTHPTAAAVRDLEAGYKPPELDPAGKTRAKRAETEANDGKPKHMHPEDHHPELFKPEFGRQHMRKRVDGPPDERNHQALNDRNRNI